MVTRRFHERGVGVPEESWDGLGFYLAVFIGSQTLQDVGDSQIRVDSGGVQLQQPVRAEGFPEGLCRDPGGADAGSPQPQVFTVPEDAHGAVVQQA